MNIVYIHTHDSGRCIEPYGHNVKTPNLMDLAQKSTLFRHCCCAAPTCSPSRAALLTGASPHSEANGMLGLAHRGFALNDYSKHLANYLGKTGYETALCGVQHEAAAAGAIGYTKILEAKKNPGFDNDINNALSAAEYIKQPKDSPFFLSFGMFHTHRVFPSDTKDIRQEYIMPPAGIYDVKTNREDMAGYHASAKAADECVGIVMDALVSSGAGNDTVVIFTTDHGIAFPRMKCNLYDTGIGVALTVKYPNNPTAGTANDFLVSHIDVFPTLCDLCGVEKPGWLEGKSFYNILGGGTDEVNSEIFAEVTYHAAYEPMRCVRTPRYKLIRRYDYHNGVVPANIDDGNSKRFLTEAGFLSRPVDREMLFDLYVDPIERENLASDGMYAGVYNDLSSRLSSWMERTGDPLLRVNHRVPAPAGARVNRLDSLEPVDCNFE